MATDVEICNLALDCIGVTKKISTLNDSDKEGRACKRWYAVLRDLVLRSYPWSFATRFAILEEIAEVDLPAQLPLALVQGGKIAAWGYVFFAPDDLLIPQYVMTQAVRRPTPPTPYQMIRNNDNDGWLIVTDEPAPVLAYTAVTAEALFPATFVEALAWRLAASLVTPLSLAPEKAKEARDMYRESIAVAFAEDANSQAHDLPSESEYITIRG